MTVLASRPTVVAPVPVGAAPVGAEAPACLVDALALAADIRAAGAAALRVHDLEERG